MSKCIGYEERRKKKYKECFGKIRLSLDDKEKEKEIKNCSSCEFASECYRESFSI